MTIINEWYNENMSNTKVLLAFGGESSEHDVSVASAKNVYAAIDREKYDVSLCCIDTAGLWSLVDSFDNLSGGSTKRLLPNLGSREFIVSPTNELLQVDVILPILHGKNGEDGSVQGLAQLLHIPIVGCDVTASAIGMDKLASKEIVSTHGVSIVPFEVHRRGDELPNYTALTERLGSPLFVKPSRAGSSVGVNKAHDENQFRDALNDAHHHDRVVLIESAMRARELEVAVLGTPPTHRVSGVGEIVPGEEFYSYDDKYASDSTATAIIPADLPDDVTEKVRRAADTIYTALGCSGLARVDFFLDETGALYFNEINTLPGFTDISMYPKLWQYQGIKYSKLIELLINDALENATIHT